MRALITAAFLATTAVAHAAEPATSPYAGHIEASMRAKAKTVGAELIDAEARLDNLFCIEADR
jgi:hypothetical protein